MRLKPTLALLPALLLVLAGCTSGASAGDADSPAGSGSSETTGAATAESQANCSAPAAGTASKSVEVTGKLGTEPTVSFTKGLSVKATQRSTVIEGSGEKALTGQLVDVAFAMYDAKTGKKVSTAGYAADDSTQFTVSSDRYLAGLVDGMHCARVGSRTVTVADASDMFGDTGSDTLGVGAGDDMVIVLDVLRRLPLKATGTPVAPKSGFPTVKLASDGTPAISIPKGKAPKGFELEVLKKGSGAKVADDATVTVQYQGVLWRTGDVFDQSWGSGPATFSTSSVVPGFKKALVGQAVGSQTLAVLPPSSGYGSGGNDTAGITGTDTLVFVIDILATN